MVLPNRVKKAVNLDVYSDDCVAWRYAKDAFQTEENNINAQNEPPPNNDEQESAIDHRLNLQVTIDNDLFQSSSDEVHPVGEPPPSHHSSTPNSILSPSANILPNKVYKLPARDFVVQDESNHRTGLRPFKKRK